MFIFLGPATFIKDLPYLWYSGQAWTGAFFGGYLSVLIIKRMNHINYSTGDIFAPALPLAQAIGRLGNLLSGDPFGLPSNLPWAITQYGVRRQPSALYKLVLDLILFVIIMRLRDFSCCLPVAPQALSQKEHGSLLYENMFRIVIIAFMDAWNFDVRSAKKCCVHNILPDGKIIPFCSYNTLHRPKYMHRTRFQEMLANGNNS